MSDSFPLCKKAGLIVRRSYVWAVDVEAYLSKIKCMCEYKEEYFSEATAKELDKAFFDSMVYGTGRVKIEYVPPAKPKEPTMEGTPTGASPEKPAPEFFKSEDFIELYGQEVREAVAEIANRLLAEHGTVVYGDMYRSNDGKTYDVGSIWNVTKLNEHGHTALLINIQPLAKPDTADGLLRELVDSNWPSEATYKLMDRAKAYLAKGGGK